jgi:hemoglobin
MAYICCERTDPLTYGSMSIPAAHAHLTVTPALVSNWLNGMFEALTALGHNQEFIDYLISQLTIPAECIRMAPQALKAGSKV